MLTGSNLTHTKQYNLRLVHEVIRLHGPLSRSDIARRTELTVQTVANLAKELIAFGLVNEAERRQNGRGAPSTVLGINPDAAFALGLDLDHDHLTGVLVDLTGAVRQRRHVRLESPSPFEAVSLMEEMADELLGAHGLTRENVRGLGVGVPGPMHQTEDGRDYLVSPEAFPGWNDVPLARWLRERLGMPVFMENNATAAAMGERWYGAGRRFRTFFYLYFGSGLGGGLVIDGQRFEGCSGNAGEIGFLPAVLAGPKGGESGGSHVGLRFNLPALYERLRAGGADADTPEDLERLFTEEHPHLLQWMDEAADVLTGVVLAVEYLIDPEAVFFGGRFPDAVLLDLMQRVRERSPARRIAGAVTSPEHLLATAGSEAAALGVATRPIYEFFAPALGVLLKHGKGLEPPALNTRLAGAVG